jgi:hypothetical protein
MPINFRTLRSKKSIHLVVWLLSSLLLVVAALLILLLSLPLQDLAGKEARKWLANQGTEAEFSVSRLDTGGITLDNIRLLPDGDLTAKHATAEYSLSMLLDKRIGTLTLSDVQATIRETEEGTFTLRGLEPLLNQPSTEDEQQPFSLPALPFDTLKAENLAITLIRKDGTTYATRGNLTLHDDYSGMLALEEVDAPLEGTDSVLLSDITLQRDSAGDAFALTIASIAHITGKRAYFTPMTLNGEIALPRDMSAVTGTIYMTDMQQRWKMEGHGSFIPETGKWEAAFSQPATSFESGILQPDMLFPVLRGQIQQVTGSTALKGRFYQDNRESEIQSEGTLTMRNLSGVAVDIPVNGINGSVSLSSLWPPATKGQQTVTVDEILLGLPLKNGKMSVTLKENGSAIFAPSTWNWADGTLSTGGATINIYEPMLPNVTLSAKGLALEQLLESLLKKGISATGRLDGEIPVSFTKDGDAMIANGRLSTVGGGTVTYSPDGESPLQLGQSFQTDLLLKALQNFRYEVLNMTINSKDAEDLNILLHVKGRNPELYDGQTIELNINLNGNLLGIVQSGMDIYTLPERLQEQLMQ